MTNNDFKRIIDKWWKNNPDCHISVCPEIEVEFSACNDSVPTITMMHNGRKIKKILSPYYTSNEIELVLDMMFCEIKRSYNGIGYAKDYDIYDSVWPVAKYIKYDSTALVKAYDNWCMSNLIKRVIFSDPCTIVIWNDGTKTIVRCTDEKFDKEKGLAMCIAKKSLGNKGKYYDVFKKWIEEDEK